MRIRDIVNQVVFREFKREGEAPAEPHAHPVCQTEFFSPAARQEPRPPSRLTSQTDQFRLTRHDLIAHEGTKKTGQLLRDFV